MLKISKMSVLCLAVVIGIVAGFSAGCVISTEPTSSAEPGLDTVKEVWDIIFDDYVDQDKVDAETLVQGAIEGMLETLDDPYTSYMNAETHELSQSGFEGKFEGIGAYVGMRNDQITIIAPIAGSPAEKAGIKAGDVILEVDGESTSDLTLNEVVLRIRGPVDTSVKILILHTDEETPVELEIVRAEIELSSVYLEMIDGIGYIHISNFTERTNEELTPVLESLEENSAEGIILDLRSNPGGLLTSVVEVTSRFVEKGVVLHYEDNNGKRTSFPVENSGDTTDLPMVILTDNFTASASEVLSGALQDYQRAVIAGTVTYGKGSVNTLHTLSDGSGVYITTHRWLTPNGRMIEGEGITPDYEIAADEDIIQWAIDYLKNHLN